MITIFHQVDLSNERVAGGIDTFIRDFVALCQPVRVLGARREENWALTQSKKDKQSVPNFVSVATLRCGRRWIPDSLRMLIGMVTHRQCLTSEVHVHRIDYVLPIKCVRPRARVVLFLHTDAKQAVGEYSDSLWRYLGSGYLCYERLALKVANKVFVLSRTDFHRVRGIRADVELAVASYDDDVFFPGSVWERRKRQAVWAGRMEEPKDPILAVEALYFARKSGHDISLQMVGSGSLKQRVIERIGELGLGDAVAVLPPLSPDALAGLLRDSMLLLHTSRFEGAPRLLLESIACGTPVVSSPAGDPESLIERGANGVIVRARTAEEFAIGIAETLRGRKLAEPETVQDRTASCVMTDLIRRSRMSGARV